MLYITYAINIIIYKYFMSFLKIMDIQVLNGIYKNNM